MIDIKDKEQQQYHKDQQLQQQKRPDDSFCYYKVNSELVCSMSCPFEYNRNN